MTTDRYQDTWNHGAVSDVIALLMDESKQPQEVMTELDISLSTASTKLRALERDGLAYKDKWTYELNIEAIYEAFISQIRQWMDHEDFQQYADKIFANDEIRNHLLNFLQTELKFGKLSTAEKKHNNMRHSISLRDAIQRYRDLDMVRLNWVYQLNETPLEEIPKEKQAFWRYLTIIQALMPRAVWTENIHPTALQSQVFPGEEDKMPTLEIQWRELSSKAENYLEELGDISEQEGGQ